MIIATFAGLSLLVAEDKLVSVDILGVFLRPRFHDWTLWAMRVSVLLISALLVHYAVRYITTPWVWIERSATLGMPRATLYTVVVFELMGLAFHQMVQVINSRPWGNTAKRVQ